MNIPLETLTRSRELTTSSEIKGPENIVPVDTFQGMGLAWHTPDAAVWVARQRRLKI